MRLLLANLSPLAVVLARHVQHLFVLSLRLLLRQKLYYHQWLRQLLVLFVQYLPRFYQKFLLDSDFRDLP